MPKKKLNHYEKLTNSIYELITNNDTLKFQDFNRYQPSNIITGKAYRGFNRIILNSALINNQFKSPFFGTYKQFKSLGADIIKGSKSIPLHFYSVIDSKNDNNKDESRMVLNFFNVFNLDQTTLNDSELKVEATEKNSDFDNLLSIPELKVSGMSAAYYEPRLDYIHMPPQNYFKNQVHWQETFLHELTHWTGHETRLKRISANEVSFGSSDYSKEELIAELGSFFLCMELGIEKNLESGSAYLKSWVKKLKNKRSELLEACKKASKACEYIISICENA